MPRNREPVFTESSGDPKLRPSVDLLLEKMRKLSSLQQHPEAVELVINDMLHHYFIDEAKRPAHLWSIGRSSIEKFMAVMGGAFPLRQDSQLLGWIFKDEHTGYTWEQYHSDIADIHQALNAEMYESKEARVAKQKATAAMARLEQAHQIPKIIPRNITILDDPDQKAGVEQIIITHTYRYASNECDCGRLYPTHKEWAKHLRIRIWRYLADEFVGDGSGN